MKEHKSVGTNLKTYYYYTNNKAEEKDVKGVIIIATGIEGTGALYDEIGEYLDSKGYALYAIDEWGYGKTGKVVKTSYKNWKRKEFHFTSYNIHALSFLAKQQHPQAPIYLIGNDFGAMLSLYLIREFPEIVDKVVTIGWGMPRAQDFGFFLTAWLRKIAFYDSSAAKMAHFNKNRRLSLRFERHEKYAWLSSDLDQVNKIKEAGFIDTPGTVGHYFYYYQRKIRTPLFMRMKKTDRNTPMLFLSGDEDLTTLKGRKTRQLERFYERKKFTNVTSRVVPGRHELLFEKNRFENLELILNWLETDTIVENYSYEANEIKNDYEDIEVIGTNPQSAPVEEKEIVLEEKEENVENIIDVTSEETPVNLNELQEAEDDLLIRTHKESK